MDSALGVGFGAKNGDCFVRAAVTYALVCALARARKTPFLSPKSCRLVAFDKTHFVRFINPRILEDNRGGFENPPPRHCETCASKSWQSINTKDKMRKSRF